ncbi:MAG: NUDIX domain-containing protein [Clostridia bacterium]|nr:NUDIX domain-containing protein [Clostridia bacterium]
MLEKWDIYDENRIKTGRTCERGGLGEGEYHLSVHICIFDGRGRMLIQKRSEDKASWAGFWDISAAGAVVAGENSREGARRELYEELGLLRDFTHIRPHFTFNYEDGYGDVYLLTEDEHPTESLTLQASEVTAAKYASREEIFELIDGGEFIPYHKSFVSLLFDTRSRYSSMSRGREGKK